MLKLRLTDQLDRSADNGDFGNAFYTAVLMLEVRLFLLDVWLLLVSLSFSLVVLRDILVANFLLI